MAVGLSVHPASDIMARVVLHQLKKIFVDKKGAEVTAVSGINLEIRDGEFMVLVGPSGCGKSLPCVWSLGSRRFPVAPFRSMTVS